MVTIGIFSIAPAISGEVDSVTVEVETFDATGGCQRSVLRRSLVFLRSCG